MNDAPDDVTPQPYSLMFLSDGWEWDAELPAQTLAEAKAAARAALEALVLEEAPEIACVYLLAGGVRIGVWDWVERQGHWTPL